MSVCNKTNNTLSTMSKSQKSAT